MFPGTLLGTTELRNYGTTELRNYGTTGTEETQTAADTSGTAAGTSETQPPPAPRGIFIFVSLNKAARHATIGVQSGRYFRMSSLRAGFASRFPTRGHV